MKYFLNVIQSLRVDGDCWLFVLELIDSVDSLVLAEFFKRIAKQKSSLVIRYYAQPFKITIEETAHLLIWRL